LAPALGRGKFRHQRSNIYRFQSALISAAQSLNFGNNNNKRSMIGTILKDLMIVNDKIQKNCLGLTSWRHFEPGRERRGAKRCAAKSLSSSNRTHCGLEIGF
jgi:hypothetical protein